jgi:hypothetical protein
MNKRLACARVSRDAVSVVTEALRDAKGAGAFDEVAEAMVVSIAAIVGRESGAAALDHLLAAAAAAAET